jgi:hypothetical protein
MIHHGGSQRASSRCEGAVEIIADAHLLIFRLPLPPPAGRSRFGSGVPTTRTVSVIVWLGAGTTLSLIVLYAQCARDGAILQSLGGITSWLGREDARAAPPSERSASASPPRPRSRKGGGGPARTARVFRSLAIFELTMLYVTVSDMVAKPTDSDTGTLVAGGVILGLAALAAVASGTRRTA